MPNQDPNNLSHPTHPCRRMALGLGLMALLWLLPLQVPAIPKDPMLYPAAALEPSTDHQPDLYDPLAQQRAEQLKLRRRLLLAVAVAALVAVVTWLVTLRRTLLHLTRDLRQRRAQLEAIIHSMGDGLVIQDQTGRVQTINPMALEINGFADEAQARRCFEGLQDTDQGYRLLDTDGREIPFEHWPLARARRFEPFRDLEATIVAEAEGRSWTGRFTGNPVRDSQGDIGLFVVTMQDITRQRQVEAEIRTLNSQLERRVDSRTRELEAAREALEFANHRLTGIIEGSRDLIAALDREFRFVAFNSAYRNEFRKLFGRHLELG
ncbi:MAG: PAS domain-containing protein, partial [Candidatus Competibacteraceae bacterium]|nr:PAS domain-containing protein [Candidatus Competibacteraceae bacterium]